LVIYQEEKAKAKELEGISTVDLYTKTYFMP
jgi:hypothetical protein